MFDRLPAPSTPLTPSSGTEEDVDDFLASLPGRVTAPQRLNLEAPSDDPVEGEDAKVDADFWDRIFDEEVRSYRATEPQRIAVAWRLVRGLLLAHETVEAVEPLSALSAASWERPRVFTGSVEQGTVRLWKTREALRRIAGKNRGVPLLPPTQTNYPKNYKTKFDTALNDYTTVVDTVVDGLELHRGSPNNPYHGQQGLRGIYPNALNTIRPCFPSRLSIIAYEERLVGETLETLIKTPALMALVEIKNRYGITAEEASILITLANRRAVDFTRATAEESKAMLILKLEDFAKRTKLAGDFRGEMQGYKALTVVLGLAKVEPEDAMAVFAKAAARVAKGEARQISEGRQHGR